MSVNKANKERLQSDCSPDKYKHIRKCMEQQTDKLIEGETGLGRQRDETNEGGAQKTNREDKHQRRRKKLN